jgi:Kdo2-lipid IVA lauroyltransferase/acyltransferase
MIRLLCWICARLSPDRVRRLGQWFGFLAFAVLRIRRRVSLENCQCALALPPAETRRVVRQAYNHLCQGALEFLQLARLTPEAAQDLLGPAGIARLKALLAQGRGLLVLTAHLGNWDLLACAAALAGLKVNAVTRQIKTTWINRYWMRQRQHCGVRLLPAQGSARQAFAALRRNEIVALVLDQHDPSGVAVPFFNRPAATGLSLARLAHLSGAPVVPVFLLRQGQGYILQVLDPLPLVNTGHRRLDHQTNTARFSLTLESVIRGYPSQWLWLHRRWKVSGTERCKSACQE